MDLRYDRQVDLLLVGWQGVSYGIPTICSPESCNAQLMLPSKYEEYGDFVLSVEAYNNGEFVSYEELTVPVSDKKFSVQELRVDPAYVVLSDEDFARYEKESVEIQGFKSTYSLIQYWSLPFVLPVPGQISSPFGVQRVFNSEPRSRHSGVDFRAKAGEPVKAISSGIVLASVNHFFAGNCIYIDHGFGVVSIYMHLSGFAVKKGDFVRAGEVVGYVGSTGRSTGPHLHLSLSVQGVMVNPAALTYR